MWSYPNYLSSQELRERKQFLSPVIFTKWSYACQTFSFPLHIEDPQGWFGYLLFNYCLCLSSQSQGLPPLLSTGKIPAGAYKEREYIYSYVSTTKLFLRGWTIQSMIAWLHRKAFKRMWRMGCLVLSKSRKSHRNRT